MNTTFHKGPLPLHITKNDDHFVIVTSQGNHYAKTFDPSAARLISSAPDLLDLLESAVARVQIANEDGNPILSAWLPDALSTLRKAKGVIE
jgi:ABC-type bacteriocin/lantibiotic exporter with double-glycine peptidase domain